MSAGGGGGRGGTPQRHSLLPAPGTGCQSPSRNLTVRRWALGWVWWDVQPSSGGWGGKLGAPEGTKGWGPHWGGRRGKGIDNRGWFDLQKRICILMTTILHAILTVVRVGTGCCRPSHQHNRGEGPWRHRGSRALTPSPSLCLADGAWRMLCTPMA